MTTRSRGSICTCLCWLSLPLLLVHLPGIRGQFQMNLTRQSKCTSGLLEHIDKFIIVVTFNPKSKGLEGLKYVSLVTAIDSSQHQFCTAEISLDCTGRVVNDVCHCDTQGDVLVLTLTQPVLKKFSGALINILYAVPMSEDSLTFEWLVPSSSALIPQVFDVNSDEVTHLQNKHSRNKYGCTFSLAKDKPVTYCCKNAPEPCMAFISVDNIILAKGTCAYHKSLELMPYTFFYTLCGVYSNQTFTCQPVLAENKSTTPFMFSNHVTVRQSDIVPSTSVVNMKYMTNEDSTEVNTGPLSSAHVTQTLGKAEAMAERSSICSLHCQIFIVIATSGATFILLFGLLYTKKRMRESRHISSSIGNKDMVHGKNKAVRGSLVVQSTSGSPIW